MRLVGLLAVAWLCALVWTGPAQGAPPPGMTMHRTQAGIPDATGWVTATSTNGGFAVRLPMKFNDFSMDSPDAKSDVLRTATVGGVLPEGVKFSATRVVYRGGAASAKTYFARFERGEGLGGKVERIERHSLPIGRAIDLTVRRGPVLALERAVLLRSDLVLMVVESPDREAHKAQDSSQLFFDSLSLTAP
jgi:hypothetical protein